jgi:hypothetical protein
MKHEKYYRLEKDYLFAFLFSPDLTRRFIFSTHHFLALNFYFLIIISNDIY